MNYFNKKLTVLIFIALILFSLAPKIAFAAGPVFETNPLILGTQTLYQLLTSGATVKEITQIIFEWAFKVAKESLKRQLLNMIVDQTVNWIQGGGDPKFITDWPGFFRDAVNTASDKFIYQLGLSQLCSPFKLQLQKAFIPIPTFSGPYGRSACTMSDVVENFDAFLKDFRQGGWIAWNQMVLQPQNNVYGAYLMAWDQYETEKAVAASAAAAEAQAGKGFLSVRRCLEPYVGAIKPDQPCTKTQVITPGAVIGDLAAKAVGSDIDYIVNAEDFAAYTAAITNAILNRIFEEGVGLLGTALSSGTGGSGGGGGSFAETQCVDYRDTEDYGNCITAVQTGVDINKFQKDNQTSLINKDLYYQNQLLKAKQDTFLILNQTFETLSDLNGCLASVCPHLTPIQGATSTLIVTNKILDIQSTITAVKIELREAEKELKELNERNFLEKVFTLFEGKADLKKNISFLKEKIKFLNQFNYCLNLSLDPNIAEIQKAISTSNVRDIREQIRKIQREILAITAHKEALKLQEVTDAAALEIEIKETQSLIEAAQQETAEKQQDMGLYQQRLSSCQAQEDAD